MEANVLVAGYGSFIIAVGEWFNRSGVAGLQMMGGGEVNGRCHVIFLNRGKHASGSNANNINGI